jgi:cell division septal protein FtsQ
LIPDKKLTEDLHDLQNLEGKDEELIQKLGEFMKLLEQSDLDSENIKQIRKTLNHALDVKINNYAVIEQIKTVSLGNLDKLDQLDQLEILLTTNHLDSKQANKIVFKNVLLKSVKIIIGFLFVTLGFAMIIMPAPPYFEMFTIFYFNDNDGVTLMDLISLIIIAIGIYIIVKSISNFKSYE